MPKANVQCALLCFLFGIMAGMPAARGESGPKLFGRNLEAPFCYVVGGDRRWPVVDGRLSTDTTVQLTAKSGDDVLAQGTTLEFSGLSVRISGDGFLEVSSEGQGGSPSFQLEVSLKSAKGPATSQTLTVRPAPPDRPLSYYADFGDDLIRIFLDWPNGPYRPIEKSGFDQYFRRLQAQGVTRLIVWLTPFPTIADPGNYSAEDWQRYEAQARAIISDDTLAGILEKKTSFSAWRWIGQLMTLRLMSEIGPMVSQSAVDHGIGLTVSYRPFEAAVTKYYEIPTFDESGNFLWWFLPLASPIVNYHPDQVCFTHYRRILKAMGKVDESTLSEIVFPNVQYDAAVLKRYIEEPENLRIVASGFPPLQDDCFVLQRQKDDDFRLVPYNTIRDQVQARLHVVTDYRLTQKDGELRVVNLNVPDAYRYLMLTDASGEVDGLRLSTRRPVELRSKAGNTLGRNNIYWSLDEPADQRSGSRVGSITGSGGYYTEFQATQASQGYLYRAPTERPLGKDVLVIDRGSPFLYEALDFQRPAARRLAVNQIKSLLAYPAFDEIFINTRSHTQLAAWMGDGVLGVRPITEYRAAGKNYTHLGIDRAFGPLGVAEVGGFENVEQITNWLPGEWNDICQSADSPFRWRYARNRAVASGMRMLLQDLEAAFPKTRIRVVIPPGESVPEVVKKGLAKLKRPDGSVYGADHYRTVSGSHNHIPSIGEGMAMVDLSGLQSEPVPLGIRFAPDRSPVKLFVDASLADLADNRGSAFRGPRSFFYEAQQTLRGKDKAGARRRREQLICDLLSRKNEINEVILYEAADWTYSLDLDDPDLCGHNFIDRCP